MKNALAYWALPSAMKEKSFLTLTPGVNVTNLLYFVSNAAAQ
jgi:hypothetical protein